MDDWLILALSREDAIWARGKVLTLCDQLGIVVNLEKSSMIPSQIVSYLGVRIQHSDFLGFADSIEDSKVLLISKRISVLKRAVCEVLEGAAGSPGLNDSSSSRGSSPPALGPVGSSCRLELPGRGRSCNVR